MNANYPNLTPWTDKIDGVDDNDATDVNQVYAEINAMETDLVPLSNAYTLVTKFYNASENDANSMFDRAIAALTMNTVGVSTVYKTILIPKGEYTLTRPIYLPVGISLVGVGGSSVLRPDFNLWQGTDFRVLVVRGAEGAAYNYDFAGRIIGDFSISALNANTVQATGVYVGTDAVIKVGDAIGYSIQDTLFRNIYCEKLDTAYRFKEADDSNAINMMGMYVRHGIDMIGKTINFNIKCNFQNFSSAYTTNAGARVGLTVDQFMYSDLVGRPEGIALLPGSLIYGAQNNVILNNVLQMVFDGCVLDGAANECIIVNAPDGFSFNNCYIYSSTTTLAIIDLLLTNSAISKHTFRNCEIVGKGALYGLRGWQRFDLDVIGCDFQFCQNALWFNNCHALNILNNHGHNNTGVFIYNQSYGDNSWVDGNTSEDNYDILRVHPTTSGTFKIGKNSAATFTTVPVSYNTTYYRGKVTIGAGASSVTFTPFGSINGSPAYIYPIINIAPYSDVTHLVSWAYNAGNGLVTLTIAPTNASVMVVYVEVIAIPTAAF